VLVTPASGYRRLAIKHGSAKTPQRRLYAHAKICKDDDSEVVALLPNLR
jgi:hypothetical protein